MSDALPAPPDLLYSKGNFVIVASSYNAEFTDSLVQATEAELRRIVKNPELAIHRVPGAFEIPIIVQETLDNDVVDAVIALGVILRGATAHADLIAQAVTASLARLTLEYRKPVIHEVLLLDDAEQARQRCLDSRLNRGTEAARIAVATLLAVRQARGL